MLISAVIQIRTKLNELIVKYIGCNFNEIGRENLYTQHARIWDKKWKTGKSGIN